MNIFDLLTKEEKEKCQRIVCEKERIIFREDEKCEHLGIVIKGLVNITSYSLNGREIVYNSLSNGQMFGNNLLYSSNPYYKGNVISSSNSEIILLDKNTLIEVLKNNESFLLAFLKYNSDFSKSLNYQIKLLSFDSAEERLLYYLKDKRKVHIKSVSSLAKSLFLTREATSRLLSKMVEEGKIRRSGNIIELL